MQNDAKCERQVTSVCTENENGLLNRDGAPFSFLSYQIAYSLLSGILGLGNSLTCFNLQTGMLLMGFRLGTGN